MHINVCKERREVQPAFLRMVGGGGAAGLWQRFSCQLLGARKAHCCCDMPCANEHLLPPRRLHAHRH